jgi:hypothetical protein
MVEMTERVEPYRSPTYYELPAPRDLDWRPFRPPSWRRYRAEWDRRGREGDPGPFPLHLDLDPTNRCNLSCSMCPRTDYLRNGRSEWAPGGPGDMDFRLYESILRESAPLGLRSVKLNFLGEPLLHPEIVRMVSLASSLGLWVMMNTNATLLDRGMSRALLEAGISDVFFSFDSPYPGEYEGIRRGAGYARTLGNIRAFMEERAALGLWGVQTRASMVLPAGGAPDLGQTKRDYIRLFRDLGVAEIGFGLPTEMGVDYSGLPRPEGFLCPDLFRRLFVFQDGVAGPCCGDWERRLVAGDASRQGIRAIWHSEFYRGLRAAHLGGRHRDVPACAACSVPYLAGAGA